jgi:hypothetical protein
MRLLPARAVKTQAEKLSEKGLRSVQCSLKEHRNGTFRPILASLGLPNPRSEWCSHPFSDSFRRGILRSSPVERACAVLR